MIRNKYWSFSVVTNEFITLKIMNKNKSNIFIYLIFINIHKNLSNLCRNLFIHIYLLTKIIYIIIIKKYNKKKGIRENNVIHYLMITQV